jgi:hypothetical protein
LQDEINRRSSLHETKKNLVISYEKVHREWLEREAELTRTIANLQNESKFLELEIRNLKKELEVRSFHLAEHKRSKYYNKIFAQMQRNLVHETLRCLFDIRCRLFVFKFDYSKRDLDFIGGYESEDEEGDDDGGGDDVAVVVDNVTEGVKDEGEMKMTAVHEDGGGDDDDEVPVIAAASASSDKLDQSKTTTSLPSRNTRRLKRRRMKALKLKLQQVAKALQSWSVSEQPNRYLGLFRIDQDFNYRGRRSAPKRHVEVVNDINRHHLQETKTLAKLKEEQMLQNHYKRNALKELHDYELDRVKTITARVIAEVNSVESLVAEFRASNVKLTEQLKERG